MANIYLPFGYPQLSGMEFSNVIYQGTLCRFYQDITDPRTDSQLFQRRINSDMAKMRATLGTFGRAVMNVGLGPAWSTVIFQMVKADLNGWWTGSKNEWASMNENDKNAWRSVAPYTATFNDYGEVFFSLSRLLAGAAVQYGGNYWSCEVWQAGQASDALTWWNRTIDQYKTLQSSDKGDYVGDWEVIGDVVRNLSAVGDYVEIYLHGQKAAIRNASGGPAGYFDCYSNDVFVANKATFLETPSSGNIVELPYRGLHRLKFVATSSSISVWWFWRK